MSMQTRMQIRLTWKCISFVLTPMVKLFEKLNINDLNRLCELTKKKHINVTSEDMQLYYDVVGRIADVLSMGRRVERRLVELQSVA